MENRINQSVIPQRTLYSGEKIPCMGLGTFGSDKYGAEAVSEAVYGAVKYGYRMIDCAAVYQNEEKIGQVLRRLFSENAMTTREVADKLAGCTLAFAPGSSWRYGTSADVLGAVVEVASGMKFGEFLEKELFGPLGMKDTAFWVPEDKQSRLAAAYEEVVEKGRKALVRYEGNHLDISNRMEKPPAFESGGAGLASTLDDYMCFARMLLGEGMGNGIQILMPSTVRYMIGAELMKTQQAAFDQWLGLEGFSYGNFMRICKNPGYACGLSREGEYGWDGWLGCYFANFPKEKMTLLIGIQKKDAGTFSLTRKLRNMVLAEL